MTITTRKFTPDEWQALRDIRLRALKSHPGLYGSNYDRENAYDQARWQEVISNPDGAVFGLYDGGALIGITGVVKDRHNPDNDSAVFVMSYIEPSHRGRGLSRYLYEARIEWVKSRDDIRFILIGHRKGNEPSRRANQAYGFAFTHTETIDWPDGTQEDELFYKLAAEDL